MKQINLLTKKNRPSEKTAIPQKLQRQGVNLYYPYLSLDGIYLDPIAISCEYLPDVLSEEPSVIDKSNTSFY